MICVYKKCVLVFKECTTTILTKMVLKITSKTFKMPMTRAEVAGGGGDELNASCCSTVERRQREEGGAAQRR